MTVPVAVVGARAVAAGPARAAGSACCRCSAWRSPPGSAAASVAPLWGRNLRRTPLFTYGMVVAHLGIAVSLAGMACDSAFTQETLVAARVGEPQRVGPVSPSRSTAIEPVVGPNWSALEATLTARRGDGAPLHPAAAVALFRQSADGDQRDARSRPGSTASSTPCSASRTSRGAGSCGCGGSRS